MMKTPLKIAAIAVMVCALLAGCGSVPANTVFSADDLPGKTIGVQENTTGDLYASDYEAEGSTIDRYSKGNEAVLALKQGKVDCVIIDEQPARAFIADSPDLMILDEPFELEEYAICLNKENTELLDAMNGVLQEMMDDGTLQNIIDGYINGGDYKYEPQDTGAPNGTLVMATEATFPPYEYHEGGSIVGIDVDIAQAICDKLGYGLTVEDMDFGAVITAVQTGKADFGMAGMTVTEERLQSANFTIPYTTATQVIIVRAK